MQRDHPDAEAPPAGDKGAERAAKGAEGGAQTAERIAKAIARAGLCSRREAEAWIAAGRVAVNGVLIDSPACTVTAHDRVEVDGKPLPQRERTRLFLYYKPVGLVTTSVDPQGRPTIFAALPKQLPRLISVGRLDIATEGLLLLTNDGGLARVLELPATGWLRRYRVRAHGRVDQAALTRLRDGLTVDGIRYGPIEASLDREQGANVWLTMAIREGKNREIRNVVEALGLQANRLIRVSFGPFQLGELGEGEVVEIKTRVLREQLGDRIAAEAACDFSAPIIPREAEEAPPARPERGRRKAQAGELQRRPEREGRRGKREHGPDRERTRERPDRAGGKRSEREGGGKYTHGARGTRTERRPPRRSDRERPDRDIEEKPEGRPRRGHAWRAEDAPLSRSYRGPGSKARALATPAAETGQKRAGLIADRKGRRVLVERFGEKKPPRSPPADGGKEQRARKPRSAHDNMTERHGGNPQPRDERKPFRGDDRKPRRGRPEPRDRPKGKGPRPSRPRPR